MNKKLRKTEGKLEREPQEAFPRERGAFKALLLTNPNYFGNLEESKLQPVLPILKNSFYEELGCVGYHPQQERLEAVVYVKQPSGYGTDICGPGTPEYVRFYLSRDGGATWQDQGMTSFQAYNIPEGTEGNKRLEYAVTLPIDPRRRFCFFDPVARVRAILSWNDPPPANMPNWLPVWGEVEEAAPMMGVNAMDLQVLRVDLDELGMAHTRFRQTFKGIPVWQGEAIVHLGGPGRQRLFRRGTPCTASRTAPCPWPGSCRRPCRAEAARPRLQVRPPR